MNRFPISMRWLLVLAVMAFGLASCGDDSPTDPGPTGSSTIRVMHANPGVTSNVVFKRDTATLATIGYGVPTAVTVANGSRKITIRATDGSELTSQDIQLDTTVSVWVVYAGNLTENKESFKVSTVKVKPAADEAAVRVIHASRNAGDFNVKVNSATGFAFTQSKISYKNASGYVTVPVAATNKLIILKAEGIGTQLLEIPTTLTAGKTYTVIVYGSADTNADPSVQLDAKVVEE